MAHYQSTLNMRSLLIQARGCLFHDQADRPGRQSTCPPVAIFGAEPAHNWCFYYQKASLARQIGNWNEIGRLYDETVAKNLEAGDKSELFPFLEGLVNSGRYNDARKLVETGCQGKGYFELLFL